MKKIFLFLIPLLGVLFTACDPIHEDMGPGASTSAEQLNASVTFTQDETDKNSFTYTTSPSTFVRIYDYNMQLVATGTDGTFRVSPWRNEANKEQPFTIQSINPDGTILSIEKQVTVGPYEPNQAILDITGGGSKKWKWDTTGCWGNGGYHSGSGADFANGSNCWYGITADALLTELGQTDTGTATGEESNDAYMIISDDGTIKAYGGNGQLIREGRFSIENYNNGKYDSNNWSIGTLKTTAGSILFPFQINGNGYKPTEFEITMLNSGKLALTYAPPGTGAWGVCTWWRFVSADNE